MNKLQSVHNKLQSVHNKLQSVHMQNAFSVYLEILTRKILVNSLHDSPNLPIFPHQNFPCTVTSTVSPVNQDT